MPETDWTNDELRTFITALRATGVFSAGEEELDHGGFRRQALASGRARASRISYVAVVPGPE